MLEYSHMQASQSDMSALIVSLVSELDVYDESTCNDFLKMKAQVDANNKDVIAQIEVVNALSSETLNAQIEFASAAALAISDLLSLSLTSLQKAVDSSPLSVMSVLKAYATFTP